MNFKTLNHIKASRTPVRYTRSFYGGRKSDATISFPLSAVEERYMNIFMYVVMGSYFSLISLFLFI